jgi:hypothetical protein
MEIIVLQNISAILLLLSALDIYSSAQHVTIKIPVNIPLMKVAYWHKYESKV